MTSTPADVLSTHCLNCDTALVGPRCHACGQPRATARLTLPHLLHEIPHAVFHVDRGLLPTLRGLALRPGRVINEYLDGRRARYFNPLTLMMIMAGLNTLLFSAFPLQLTGMIAGVGATAETQALQSGMALIYRYFALSMAALLPLMAAISWLCFLGRGRCFGEHLTLQAFIGGFMSFFGICIYFPLRIFDDSPLGGLVWLVYSLLQTLYYFVVLAAVFWRNGRIWTTLLRSAAFVVLYTVATSILFAHVFALFQGRG
jgi:hypothetical protein